MTLYPHLISQAEEISALLLDTDPCTARTLAYKLALFDDSVEHAADVEVDRLQESRVFTTVRETLQEKLRNSHRCLCCTTYRDAPVNFTCSICHGRHSAGSPRMTPNSMRMMGVQHLAKKGASWSKYCICKTVCRTWESDFDCKVCGDWNSSR